MAYFECIVGNGGGGTDIPLIVNCDAQFAGHTISATQGQTTLIATCPSTSPYQVLFHLPTDGTWTVSGTISGQTYSQSITISEYEINLFAGFDYTAWLTAGGLDPSDYASLAAVFADEAAVRQLMLTHASVDYLISKVSDDVDVLDDFVANDTAMKWLGLSNYATDGIVAITGAEAKLLASTYWERYLKDHVPVMTSDTAPYGTASGNDEWSGGPAYKAFDGDDTTVASATNNVTTAYVYYKFTNPINVRKVFVYSTVNVSDAITIKVEYSDDGTNWTQTASTYSYTKGNRTYYDIEDCGYHLYWKCIRVTSTAQGGVFNTLQFYGRQLSVSVPVMTGANTPYGEASASSSYQTSQGPYYVFNGSNSGEWHSSSGAPQWIQYHFPSKMKLKMVMLRNRNGSSGNNHGVATFKMLGSNDGFVNDIHELSDVLTNPSPSTVNAVSFYDISTNKEYEYIRFSALTGQDTEYISISQLQFYGLDYSEKEFEAGATKKWLYDHGVELETFENLGSGAITREDSQIGYNKTASGENGIETVNTINMANYNLIRAKVGDVITAANNELAVSGYTAYKIIATSDMPNNANLDVSAISENKKILFTPNQASATGKFTLSELWVE